MKNKKYNRKIDIIIPAYNVPDNTIFRCLSSIACQNIIEEIEITIIDDASTKENYKKIADIFKDYININIIRNEINQGPGVARQIGIDNTKNGYITFMDADDTLNGTFAIDYLREGIEQDSAYQICVGIFDEIHNENEEKILTSHENDSVWVFGKMFKRAFIDRYNIRFHPTSRANEDNGFNKLCLLCLSEFERINYISNHVYYWHENLESITRKNDCHYTYGSSKKDSFYGFVENMIYAIKEGKKRKPGNELIRTYSITFMFLLYQYYIDCVANASEYAKDNFEYCKKYYKEIFYEYEKFICERDIVFCYSKMMKEAYATDKMDNIVPTISIFEFLNKLKED